MSVIGIMKASTTMEKFKENIRIAFPNARIQRLKRLKKAERERIELSGQMDLGFEYL